MGDWEVCNGWVRLPCRNSGVYGWYGSVGPETIVGYRTSERYRATVYAIIEASALSRISMVYIGVVALR